ncbi:hypothetical protein EP867_06750 [Falsigemmobacter intermedius]|uniref:Uncharacterized protein n=1 Tax=Falsigemmobacter intermedius TaxID=1553448 RepID=A0A3S3YLT6_9RHOB|nr:hypothetical protein EP867_06750 [Falsigemmobacter intermedius]
MRSKSSRSSCREGALHIWHIDAVGGRLHHHTRALRDTPACCLLIGEPGAQGDPLTHPRLSLQARAVFPDDGHEARLGLWLKAHPKARIYAGLPDFRFLRFEPVAGFLNGGFGRAFRFTPEELRP